MVSHNRLPPNNKTKGVVKLLLSHGEGAVKLLLIHGEGVVKLLLSHRGGAVKLLLTHGEGVVKLLLTHPMGGGEGFPGCTSGRVPQPQPNGGGRGPPRLQQRPGPSNSPLARVKARVWWKTPDPGWISSAPRVGVKARAWRHLPGPGWIPPDEGGRGLPRLHQRPGPSISPEDGVKARAWRYLPGPGWIPPVARVKVRVWRQKLPDPGWILSAPRVGVKARAWCHLPGPGWILPNEGGRGLPRLQQWPGTWLHQWPGPSISPSARVKARVWWKTPDPGWILSTPRVGVKARAWCHLPGPGWISPDSQRGGHRPDPWPGPTQQPNLRPTGKETRTWRQKLTDSGGTPSRSLSNIHQTNRLPGLKGTTLTYISTRQQKLHGAEPHYRGIQLNTTTKKQ